MPPMSAESTVSRNYLDWLLAVPWKKKSKEEIKEIFQFGGITQRIAKTLRDQAAGQRSAHLRGDAGVGCGPEDFGQRRDS